MSPKNNVLLNLLLDGKESTFVADFIFLKQLFSYIIFLSPEKEIDIKVFEFFENKSILL